MKFLDYLPNGLDTEYGENGVQPTGGQRQRIAVARAFLKDADFLLLNEETSHLDPGLEEQVHTAIEVLDRDYGMVVVAYHLSTVTNTDRIYAMEPGQIVK